MNTAGGISSYSWTAAGGYTCATCSAWVPWGQVHNCVSRVWPAANGYTCACGAWVVYGIPHACGVQSWKWLTTVTQTLTGSPCLKCGRQVPHGAEHDCPADRPLPPVADAVAKLRDLLGKAQKWLEGKRL